ncbi:hypothetical protein GCM10010191_01380 [Actinomadura vinacea]|uniref:WD40 repeat domain-containing protein n=1 Tax=Actinomadura vinacea TaxID=115336 RepID=A0ABP5VB95_9ACTN
MKEFVIVDVRGKRVVLDPPLLSEEMRRRLEELGAEVGARPSGPGDVAFAWFGDAFEGVPVLPAAELMDAVVSGGGHDVAVPAWFEEERARLEALERERGVTDEHRAATARLREHGARLRHPYVNVGATFMDEALSPCGRWLATARWDMDDDAGTLQIWEMATGRSVNGIDGIEDGPGWPGYETVRWSSDGTRVAVTFNTNVVGVWDPFGERLNPFGSADVTNGKDAAPIFALRPDGSGAYISMGSDHEVKGCVAALDQGEVFYTGSGHGAAGPEPELLPEPIPAEFARRLNRREWFFSRVHWSKDGTRLLGSDGRGWACSIDMPGGRMRWLARADAPVEFSPDDRRLASVTGGFLRVFDADTGERVGEPVRRPEGSLHWGMRGNTPVLAVVADNGGGVTLYDENGRPLHHLSIATTEHTGRGFFDEGRPWAWAPAGTHGACLTGDDRVEVWSLVGTAARAASFPVPEGSVAVLWGAGDVLAVLGERTLRFVRAGTGEAVGDYTFGCRDDEDDENEAPAEWEGPLHDVFEADPFPLDGGRWCALASPAAGPGAALVIGEDRGDLDSVLAWVVGRRFAWPVRWGGLDVVPDAEAAAARLELGGRS